MDSLVGRAEYWWQDDSVDKVLALQGHRPEFERRGLTPQSCHLTSACLPWHIGALPGTIIVNGLI